MLSPRSSPVPSVLPAPRVARHVWPGRRHGPWIWRGPGKVCRAARVSLGSLQGCPPGTLGPAELLVSLGEPSRGPLVFAAEAGSWPSFSSSSHSERQPRAGRSLVGGGQMGAASGAALPSGGPRCPCHRLAHTWPWLCAPGTFTGPASRWLRPRWSPPSPPLPPSCSSIHPGTVSPCGGAPCPTPSR